jgi:two-component system, OmpR family, KDP operon response regulator KdpE
MGARVLVVDDEPPILRVVAANLRARGYEVLTAASGEAALTAVQAHQPDCIVLDLGLPGIDGLQVLRHLRSWTMTPVIILTAMGGERDKARALELGADDYVTKPFGMADLLARIRVALRHGQAPGSRGPSIIRAGAVQIDLETRCVARDGQPVQLTQTEYRLLEVLATNAGRLCTDRFLIEQVWGPGRDEKGQDLRAALANLRRKLDDESVPQLLVSEPGTGYRLLTPH